MTIWTALILGYILTLGLVPRVLLSDKRPVATLAWIWSIVLFPYLGALCYLAFGSEHIHRKRLVRRAGFKSSRAARKDRRELERSMYALSPTERDLLRLISRINEIATSTADDVEILYCAPAFFEQLHRAIDDATHHVHIQFYIWRDDHYGQKLLDALVRAAKRGVEVRILIDEMGSLGLRSKVFAPLVAAGGKFSWALTIDPLRNRFFWHLRNHRKLQVIDGAVAFVGGMNVGCEYFGEDPAIGPWRDAQLRLTGPIVAQLQESFADDWYFATEEEVTAPAYYTAADVPHPPVQERCVSQLIASGPDRRNEPLQKSLVALLNHATKRVWISTGYFVPNHLLMTAVELCAVRGVDVRLLVAQQSDYRFMVHISRSHYEDMLRAGVRVYEYDEGFLHAKMMLIDDEWIHIGSANWDIRSMRLNFELGVLFKSHAQADVLERIFRDEMDRAREIKLDVFLNRPFSQRLREAVLRPISPLM